MSSTEIPNSEPDAATNTTGANTKQWFKAQENAQTGEVRPLSTALNALSFDANGLIPVIAQCAETQVVLMMAWMNAQALRETLDTGWVCYWSRSRGKLWRKGESSGHRQKLVSLHIDCDGDTLLARVAQTGAACHTNRQHCFFWQIDAEQAQMHLTEQLDQDSTR